MQSDSFQTLCKFLLSDNSPITSKNAYSPSTFSEIGYSQMFNLTDLGVTTPFNLTIGSYTLNTVLSVQNLYVIGAHQFKYSLVFNTARGFLNLNSFDAGVSPYVSQYCIMSYVNEVRSMMCSRTVCIPNTNGANYFVGIYPTGTAGTLLLLRNSYIRITLIA